MSGAPSRHRGAAVRRLDRVVRCAAAPASSTTRPPSSVIVRSATAASAARCVTWTTPRPSRCTSSWNSATSCARPVASTIAVDSSEINSCGRGRARPRPRAVAARRPTASTSPGRRARRSPTRSRNASTSTCSRLGHAPHDVVAHADAEHLRLRALRRRSPCRRRVRGRPRPGVRARPPVGARRPASRRASVDLPEPFAPTIATSSAGAHLERDVGERVAVRVRVAVAHVAQRDRQRFGRVGVVGVGRRDVGFDDRRHRTRRARAAAPASRVRSASQMPNHSRRKSVSGTLIHQSRTTHVDEVLARRARGRTRPRLRRRWNSPLPAVADLVERELAQVREHEQQRESVSTAPRGHSDREPDDHRAAATPVAAVGRADERAERRARAHRGERRAPDDEEPDDRRRDRAGDHRAQAVPRRDDRERDDRGDEQRAAERHDLTDDGQRERDVGQDDGLGELARAESARGHVVDRGRFIPTGSRTRSTLPARRARLAPKGPIRGQARRRCRGHGSQAAARRPA